MPLTTDEQKITAYAYALRHDEQPGKDLWFAWDDWDLPELHRLWESGYLERRRHDRDFVYRITDQAMTAQELCKLTTGQSPN